jgi:hypothetical protein
MGLDIQFNKKLLRLSIGKTGHNLSIEGNGPIKYYGNYIGYIWG